MTPARFRQLLVLYIVVTLAAIPAAWLPGGYSQELADAYARESDLWVDSRLWLIIGVAIPLVVAALAGLVGLFLFKPWGRSLSLYSTLASLLLVPLDSPTLYSKWESGLWTVSDVLWGVVLASAYFAPVADRFIAGASPQPKPLHDAA